ncbi:MAG: 50S ribosomal protein L23 [Myxococcales bacterium]|nr:50S ribosomal protein L23 [Myxococcales bacterium]USN50892.1 MAG: 50S ribosomal protein L23 [Myxococcales bacterium]
MFDQCNVYEVLRRPILTEKCSQMRESQNKILVEVAPWANKYQIVQAAKALFNVEVVDVNTLNYRGKIKRVRQQMGKRKNTKRAYLTLKNGSDVDLFGLIGQEVSHQEEQNA